MNAIASIAPRTFLMIKEWEGGGEEGERGGGGKENMVNEEYY